MNYKKDFFFLNNKLILQIIIDMQNRYSKYKNKNTFCKFI